jgi:hypothetical protein
LCGKALTMSIFHQGYALKVFLQDQPKWKHTPSKVADILGVSRQAISGLYGHEVLPPDYVEKLRGAGIEIPGITGAAEGPNVQIVSEPATGYATANANGEVLTLLRSRVKDLEELLRLKDILIDAANAEIKEWSEYAGELEKKLGREPHDL